jgi:hypothetical protein
LTPGPAGDVNNDSLVNGQDIAAVASNWLASVAGLGAAAGGADMAAASGAAYSVTSNEKKSSLSTVVITVPPPNQLGVAAAGTVTSEMPYSLKPIKGDSVQRGSTGNQTIRPIDALTQSSIRAGAFSSGDIAQPLLSSLDEETLAAVAMAVSTRK